MFTMLTNQIHKKLLNSLQIMKISTHNVNSSAVPSTLRDQLQLRINDKSTDLRDILGLLYLEHNVEMQ